MARDPKDIDQRLELLQELLACNGTVYRWCYSETGSLLETNCPKLVVSKLLESGHTLEYLLEYAAGRTKPVILNHSTGMMWGAVLECREDKLQRIHILGPVFNSAISLFTFNSYITNEVTQSWKPKLLRILQDIPVVTVTNLINHTLMLEYCVNERHLSVGDITFQSQTELFGKSADPPPRRDGNKAWMIEQALMRMIREGDLNYKKAMERAVQENEGAQIFSSDNLAKARVAQIMLAANCVHAAVEGGVSPDAAYAKSDSYIQQILNSTTLSQLMGIGFTMYGDFVHMVRKCRTNPAYSKQIQSCCDYIEEHVEEKISLEKLAKRVGYTTYYLSHKFKQETGGSINNYIKIAKIEYAKVLLATTQDSIQSISDRLCFSARSFFADEFKQITGVAPAAYRKQHQRL